MPYDGETGVSNEGNLTLFEFDFEGKSNAKEVPNSKGQLNASKAEQAAVDHFNTRAGDLEIRLRQEVERVLMSLARGSVVAEVEVKFRYEPNQSVIIAGFMTALGALGPFAAQVAAGTLAPPLAKLLESAVKRVVRGWQKEPEVRGERRPRPAALEPFTINVSVRRALQLGAQSPTSEDLPQVPPPETDSQPSTLETRQSLTGQSATPWLQVQQQTLSPPAVKEMSDAIETGRSHWLLPAIAIGTAVIVTLLAVLLTVVIMNTT